MFWRSKKLDVKLAAVEREASKVHRKNITKIVQTRQGIDKLNRVLKENNIILSLAHVLGHN